MCYDIENLEPPILSVEEAVSRSSFFESPALFSPEHIGDFLKGMSEADHKIHSAEVCLTNRFCAFFSFFPIIITKYDFFNFVLIQFKYYLYILNLSMLY